MEFSYYHFDTLNPISIEIKTKIIDDQTGLAIVYPIFSLKNESHVLNKAEELIFSFVDLNMKNEKIEIKTSPFYYIWNEFVLLLETMIEKEVNYDWESMISPMIVEKNDFIGIIKRFYIKNKAEEILWYNLEESKERIKQYIIKLECFEKVNTNQLIFEELNPESTATESTATEST